MPEIEDNSVEMNEEPGTWARARRGLDAVAVRIGLNGAQLVLVDDTGEWERWVYPSVDEAASAARALEIPVHIGEYPDGVRIRINSYRRRADGYGRAPYPEQGMVGPVIPYPENRPRRPGSGTIDEPPPHRSPEDAGS